MLGDKYAVLTSVRLTFGSHTQNLSGTHSQTYGPGSILTLDSDPEGHCNVWFSDEDGNRGKIECGSARNLVGRGAVRKVTK